MKYIIKSKSTNEYIVEKDNRVLVKGGTREQAYALEQEYAERLCANDNDMEMEEIE